VKLRVSGRVDGDLEEGREDVLEKFAKVAQHALGVVHPVQPRDLYHPAVVRRVELVVDHPAGESVPLVGLAPIDGDPVLGVLVLGLLEIGEELLRDHREVPSANHVICLQEDVAQVAHAERVVLEVELVEATES